MSLHIVQPPARTLRVAKTWLGRLKAGPGFLTRGALAASDCDELCLAAPHPVFNLQVAGIGLADALGRTRMTGWRFFVLAQTGAVATMELTARGRSDDAHFARVTDGRMAASSARAIRRAEASAHASARRYALGMLRVPALHVYALWLRDLDSGAHDLFAAVEPVTAPMIAERWLSLDDFIGKLAAARDTQSARPDDAANLM